MTPWSFAAAPLTSTILSPVPVFSCAVTVTTPVLAVAPAAMVSLVPVSVKSLLFVSFPAAALTVTVVTALDG